MKYFPLTFLKLVTLILISFTIIVFLELFLTLFIKKNNYSSKNSLNKLLTKTVSNRYLTYEPYVVRGKLVNNFFIDCNKIECLPFGKSKISDENLFSKELKKISNLEKKIIILPLSLEQKFPYIYFYKNFPIYFNFTGLGQFYYSNKITQNLLLNRYKNSYLLDTCYLNFINRNFDQYKEKLNLFNKILLKNKVYKKKEFDCSKITLHNLIKTLKKEKVGYLIENKDLNYKNIFKKEFCYSNYCLFKFL